MRESEAGGLQGPCRHRLGKPCSCLFVALHSPAPGSPGLTSSLPLSPACVPPVSRPLRAASCHPSLLCPQCLASSKCSGVLVMRLQDLSLALPAVGMAATVPCAFVAWNSALSAAYPRCSLHQQGRNVHMC